LVYCTKCGSENPENSEFCQECGSKLAITEKQTSNKDESTVDMKPSMILVVLGYIFAISGLLFGLIGGLIGIVIGLYLYTRKNPKAKLHGRNIIVIAALMVVLSYQLIRIFNL
jgi:uncharacterized membrane protein YvbJ